VTMLIFFFWLGDLLVFTIAFFPWRCDPWYRISYLFMHAWNGLFMLWLWHNNYFFLSFFILC